MTGVIHTGGAPTPRPGHGVKIVGTNPLHPSESHSYDDDTCSPHVTGANRTRPVRWLVGIVARLSWREVLRLQINSIFVPQPITLGRGGTIPGTTTTNPLHPIVFPVRLCFIFGSDSVLVWIRVLVFWEHRELFPLAISYKILNFWISFGSPRTIPKVKDVSGGVNQIGRTNEVKMKNLWS